VAVGTALKKNTNNGLQEVDFSHNRMGEKGALGFAQGLMSLQRGLVLLNLANNAITPRGALSPSLRSPMVWDLNSRKTIPRDLTGISSVVSSLSDNLSIATTLTSLDLSANKIEKSGAQTNSHEIGAKIKCSTEG
jgi:Ran GTPase-activating protein (RanGAP) involved in mRNA processing and transport